MEGEGPLRLAAPEAYIFDLDGTLASIPVEWDGVRERLREVTGSTAEFKPIFPTIGELIADDPKMGRAVFAVIDEFEWAAVPSARLYDGAFQLLSRLSQRAKVSLVTLQGRGAATRVLEMFDLKQFFSYYFTREDSLERAEQVEMALSSMRAKKLSSVFVGDRFNDLNAAKKLGISFAMIRTHGEDPEDEDVPVYHSLAEFASTLS
jgi:phosphoglycolate phosphatase-like HAD superfamily hydrolase